MTLTLEACLPMWCCSLLTTFQLQRPGVEDVAVLKKELVQVQTLMDKMTLERERESEKLKDECKHLQAEQANSKVIIIHKDMCSSLAMISIWKCKILINHNEKACFLVESSHFWKSFGYSALLSVTTSTSIQAENKGCSISDLDL